MIIAYYLVIVCIVVFLSTKISYCVDKLDRQTSLSGAFIGGVMLAAVTSLPELFTSIASILFLKSPDMVLGNILGSNVFNIAALCFVFLFTLKGLNKGRISKSHMITAIGTLIVYFLIAITVYLNMDYEILTVSTTSILIVVIYIITVKRMSESAESSEAYRAEQPSEGSVKRIVIEFIMYSILLVIASIGMTFLSDKLGTQYNMGATLAGALFLGVATSLPEFSSTAILCRIGNFDAAVGNIIGSNIFNYTILSISDILYFGDGIYLYNNQTSSLIIFGVINTFILMSIMAVKRSKNLNKKIGKYLYLILSILSVSVYITFVAINI